MDDSRTPGRARPDSRERSTRRRAATGGPFPVGPWRAFRLAWTLFPAVALATAPASAFIQYQNVADEVGVAFRHAGEVHSEGIDLWPAYPEIMGGGACWADFDGDGYEDLYLVNQRFNPENPAVGAWADAVDPTSRLYRNNGDGTFTDVTVAAGVDARRFGYGCSAADYDGDADLDLFVAVFGEETWGGNLLYRNEGEGSFTELGVAAGVDGVGLCGDSPCMSTSSAWADYDLDGDLDLYVANNLETSLTDTNRGPTLHKGQKNFLFRNDGNGTFANVADAAGVAGNNADEHGSKSLGVVWFDCDLDGDLDLFVANDQTEDNFYINHGDGTFTEEAADRGVDDIRAGMGVAGLDYDNDGYPDLHITHYAGENNGFYRNRADCTYQDRSGEDQQTNAFTHVGWGTAFADLDRDGDLDLHVINGHTERTADNYNDSSLIFRNDAEPAPAGPGDRRWIDVSGEAGPGAAETRVNRGSAYADFDYDGDVDIVTVPNANQTAQVLRASGVANHWLLLELRQPGLNRHAVGARVIVEAGGSTQYREVQAGSSYLSQNMLALDFGLGGNLVADRVTVRWPGGATTILTNVVADQLIRLDQATGTYVTDTVSPLTQASLAGTPGDNGWWTSPVAATLAAADRGVSFLSGVASTEYAVDDGAWTGYTAGTIIPMGDGDHRLRSRSTDGIGNREPARTVRVPVDTTPPALLPPTLNGTRGNEDWWIAEPVNVTLHAMDATSGVAEILFRRDDGPWTRFDEPITIDEDGLHRIEHRARDAAGNEAPSATFEVRLDRLPPAVDLTQPLEGGVYWGAQRLATADAPPLGRPAFILSSVEVAGLGGSEFPVRAVGHDGTSGLERVEFWLNGTRMATQTVGPFLWTWPTASAPSGVHSVKAVAFDHAGNRNESAVRVVLASTTPEGILETLTHGPPLHLAGAPGWAPPAAGGLVGPGPVEAWAG